MICVRMPQVLATLLCTCLPALAAPSPAPPAMDRYFLSFVAAGEPALEDQRTVTELLRRVGGEALGPWMQGVGLQVVIPRSALKEVGQHELVRSLQPMKVLAEATDSGQADAPKKKKKKKRKTSAAQKEEL
jgi:hypothetical protein